MGEMKFEDALQKLETIVSDMESGELTLENSLKKYEEGMKLSRFCTKKLKEAEKKIEILLKDKDGKVKAREFDPSEFENNQKEPQEKPSKKTPGKPKEPEEEDEGDLLF